MVHIENHFLLLPSSSGQRANTEMRYTLLCGAAESLGVAPHFCRRDITDRYPRKKYHKEPFKQKHVKVSKATHADELTTHKAKKQKHRHTGSTVNNTLLN